MILETERLFLRTLTANDYAGLCDILQDEKVMYAYEHAFSDEEVLHWLNRQLQRYRENGFGLWAVVLKHSGKLIGQAGITLQPWRHRQVHEIGYLFNRRYWHHGYATEAASGCRDYAFCQLGLTEVYSIIRDNNIASQNVAVRNGMTMVGTDIRYYAGYTMPHLVYRIRKQDWSFLPDQDERFSEK